jgi:hypothetical protein
MESVDYYDRHLDPPDPPTYSACDGCGVVMDTGDLTKTGRCWPYRWLCDECAAEDDEG